MPRPPRSELASMLNDLVAAKVLQIKVEQQSILVHLPEGKTLRIARPPSTFS